MALGGPVCACLGLEQRAVAAANVTGMRCEVCTLPQCLCPAVPAVKLLLSRFTYCALLACSILGRMQSLDVAAAVDFVKACKNFDGGFGCTPGRQGMGQQLCTAVFGC